MAGLDKVFENRDRHHRIRRQILRQNEGLILILAQRSGGRGRVGSYTTLQLVNI